MSTRGAGAVSSIVLGERAADPSAAARSGAVARWAFLGALLESGMARSAAALVIGNELLTGKVAEANIPGLARMLFSLGVRLERVVVCRDDVAIIATEVGALRRAYDVVFTSGGVGPTHDDVTIPAVARALGVSIVRHDELARRIREHFGAGTTEGHLRMADLPVGTRLLSRAAAEWPVIVVENVFVLPGIPEIFARKLDVVREELGVDTPFLSAAIFTRCDEGAIAELLLRIEREHGVTVGSYPTIGGDHSVKITFDGIDAGALDAALDACLEGLDRALVVRVERPR